MLTYTVYTLASTSELRTSVIHDVNLGENVKKFLQRLDKNRASCWCVLYR